MSIKEEYLSEDEIVEVLKIKKTTLAKNRCIGKGHPPFIKCGRAILYPKQEFKNWIKNFRVIKEMATNAN
jgi:hypothetical protein